MPTKIFWFAGSFALAITTTAFTIATIVSVFAMGLPTLANAQSLGVTLPTVPAGITATVVPPSQVSISWGGSTESSGTIEDYNVYRNGAQITTTPGTSIVDSGLSPGIYIYTVSASDAAGNISLQSSPASASVLSYTMPPSVPTNVTITGATTTNSAYAPTTLTISWTAATDTIGIAGYKVYRNGTWITSSTATVTGTSITDSVLPGSYSYRVEAYDAAQNISNLSAPATVTVIAYNTAPPTPANISIQQVSLTGVTLSWSPSISPIGIAGYQVFRDGIQIATVTGSPYADTGLAEDVSYSYALTSYDVAGNISLKSTPITLNIQATPGPATPRIGSAMFIPTSTVEISWGAVGDVLAITSYTVYRNGAQIATTPGTSTVYFDEGLATGTYAYAISATDIAGEVSATSSAVSVVVSAISTSTPTSATPSAPIVTGIPGVPTATAGATKPSPTLTSGNVTFTQFLYFGLRGTQVQALQSLLAQNGYLSPANATGYFGSLTLAALEKFQCAENVVCTGGAGWGTVGPKTRAALNASATVSANTSITTNAPTQTQSSLAAELQMLEAELAALEKQAN